jgi:hypothetical protein
MNLPFTLPDWLPAWAFLLLAIPALLFALAFLVMPFSVFGVKARLEAIEAQLDTITEEVRNLNLRARGIAGQGFADDGDALDVLPNFGRQRTAPAGDSPRAAAPIPPPPVLPRGGGAPPRPARRTEPRLD